MDMTLDNNLIFFSSEPLECEQMLPSGALCSIEFPDASKSYVKFLGCVRENALGDFTNISLDCARPAQNGGRVVHTSLTRERREVLAEPSLARQACVQLCVIQVWRRNRRAGSDNISQDIEGSACQVLDWIDNPSSRREGPPCRRDLCQLLERLFVPKRSENGMIGVDFQVESLLDGFLKVL
jgi:hypothetical protein